MENRKELLQKLEECRESLLRHRIAITVAILALVPLCIFQHDIPKPVLLSLCGIIAVAICYFYLAIQNKNEKETVITYQLFELREP